jgi:hypothetical protein
VFQHDTGCEHPKGIFKRMRALRRKIMLVAQNAIFVAHSPDYIPHGRQIPSNCRGSSSPKRIQVGAPNCIQQVAISVVGSERIASLQVPKMTEVALKWAHQVISIPGRHKFVLVLK